MAVLSPALVVSMCVMFVLTRLHIHYYIFENPLLFGLKYCLEPDRDQIQAIHQSSSAPSKPSKKSRPSKSQKQKPSVSSLVIRRTKLDAAFFSAEAQFPLHRQLDHLLTITSGYLAAYIFEDLFTCLFPSLFSNSRSTYVALFAVSFAIFQLIQISLQMTSPKIILALISLAWIVAIFLISAGDFTSFIRFDEAFTALSQSAVHTMVTRLDISGDVALARAKSLVIFSRIFIATIAALIAACVAASARRFSRIDYDLYRQYRLHEYLRDDPYALERPTAASIATISLDYLVPAVTIFVWCVSPRAEVADGYAAWRLSALAACAVMKGLAMRVRLQSYLDGAIDSYRMFWADKTASNALQAGQRCTFQVIGTSFYLMMITMSYVGPIVISTVLTLVAKRDGGVRLGFCPVRSEEIPLAGEAFPREIAAFLAWWSVACYLVFAMVSLLVEFLIDVLDPSARERGVKSPPPSSSSERRRQKRMMRSGNA